MLSRIRETNTAMAADKTRYIAKRAILAHDATKKQHTRHLHLLAWTRQKRNESRAEKRELVTHLDNLSACLDDFYSFEGKMARLTNTITVIHLSPASPQRDELIHSLEALALESKSEYETTAKGLETAASSQTRISELREELASIDSDLQNKNWHNMQTRMESAHAPIILAMIDTGIHQFIAEHTAKYL
jgi:hypothetical protein